MKNKIRSSPRRCNWYLVFACECGTRKSSGESEGADDTQTPATWMRWTATFVTRSRPVTMSSLKVKRQRRESCAWRCGHDVDRARGSLPARLKGPGRHVVLH